MSHNPFGAAQAGSISNNPFLEDPSAAHNRYPALHNLDAAGSPSASYGASPYGSPAGVASYQQPQPTGFYSAAPGYGAYSQPASGFANQPAQLQPLAFQPTGYFGSSAQSPTPASPYASQYSGSPYGAAPAGYGSGFMQQPQQQWQPANRAAPHLQDLDPLSGVSSQAWGGPGQQQQQQQQQSQQGAYSGGLSGGASPLPPPHAEEHPRAWIRSHKAELEIWDPTSWKQALLRFDELQTQWERRKFDVQSRVDASQRGFLPPHEAPHWQNLLKEAISNIDTVAASKYQMQEALTGYKQSSDIASKRRVKECLNASIISLPDWPPQL